MKKLTSFKQLFIVFCLAAGLSSVAHAATYQKPGAAIRLADTDREFVQLDPFSKKTVTINFNSSSKGQLFISAKPKPGIEISGDSGEMYFDLSHEKPQLTFTINAQESGKYYIMFHARIIENNLSTSRVFGIPVYIGDIDAVQAKLKQKTKKDFIIMQAEETITQP